MTATDELRRMLGERGVEWWNETDPEPQSITMARADEQLIEYHENANGSTGYHIFNMHDLTPEQAIAATLGETPTPPQPTLPKQPPYDELIESLRRDWDIEASWDGLRRFWYVGLTDEGVRKRDEREATLGRGTMTADDVRDLIERHSDACGGNGRDFHNGAYVAIVDELNATLGRGTCHPVTNDNLNESEGTGDAWANCSECGHLLCVLTDPRSQMPNYCPNCGRRIVEVD